MAVRAVADPILAQLRQERGLHVVLGRHALDCFPGEQQPLHRLNMAQVAASGDKILPARLHRHRAEGGVESTVK